MREFTSRIRNWNMKAVVAVLGRRSADDRGLAPPQTATV